MRPYATMACVFAVCCLSALAQTAPAREHFDHATVTYDWVTNGRGERLRTFVTRPNSAGMQAANAAIVPVIFVVGWLSCDSVEYPDSNTTDGFGIFLRRIIDESGYATVRMDKPGVGESQGDCAKADFKSEMEGYQAAFAAMSKYDFIVEDRVFVVGIWIGGGFSQMVTGWRVVRGYFSWGSWGRTWYEHMLELERRRLTASRKTPAEVSSAVKSFAEFYQLYLMKGMTPGQVVAEHPEWKALWYDAPDGQYGRPAAFYQQLQALNLGEVWQNVSAPVLVLRGTSDDIMSAADAEAIAQSVNQAHSGHARFVQFEIATHGFTVNGKFDGEIVTTVLDWMKQQLAQK
jgi:pimeloyl-ACP methyl ester carboxylesterase